MTLTPGRHLGPYRIVAAAGAGGMGEVYRAVDSRLDRQVAIKILPDEFSRDAKLRVRFEREAKAISALNHPHVCTLYDVGHEDGLDYLVMEYVEGETLSQRLARGRLPFEQVLQYGMELADALAAAHHCGVIHRDLKPSNVMLTKSGVKLLDFGLAKYTPTAVSDSEVTAHRAEPLSAQGRVIGTLQYMSPEQVEGKPADARTDIFTLGAILYEMATGARPFGASSDASLIASILREEPPPVSRHTPISPPAFDEVVRGCLAKEPDDRWQSAHDVKLALACIATGLPATIQAETPKRRTGLWIAAAGVALILGVLAGHEIRFRPTAEPIRFSILPPGQTFFAGTENSATALQFAVSPDGRFVVFVASTLERRTLWLRPLDAVEAKLLEGTDGASFPFWSPDSSSIAFFAGGKLKRIALGGGKPQIIADAPDPRGGSWGRGGIIVFASSVAGPLYRVSESGGEPASATTLNRARQERSHRWPRFLPDGHHFLYLSMAGDREHRGVYAASLGAPDSTFILRNDSAAEYVPAGHLLFLRGGGLYSQPFHLKSFRLSGEPVLIAQDVGFAPGLRYSAFSASATDVLIYASGVTPNRQLTWFNRKGEVLGTVVDPGDWGALSLLPDQQKVSAAKSDPVTGNIDLWLIDLRRNVASRLTSGSGDNLNAVFSPDGTRMVFTSNRAGLPDLYIRNFSGPGEELLLSSATAASVSDWTRDGRYIVYSDRNPNTGSDLWLIPLDNLKPRIFLQSRFNESQPYVSPDGRWIAYVSNDSGRSEVYVQPFPNGGERWQVSTMGGTAPRWRADGRELFYITARGEIAAAPVRIGSNFEPGTPTVLFQVPGLLVTPLGSSLVVSADGRFLVNVTVAENRPTTITAAIHWQNALK